MTQTLPRPPLQRPPAPTAAPPWGAGLAAAAWAVGASLVIVALPVLLVWATDSRSGSGAAAALRMAGYVWLLGHGAPLSVPGSTIALAPLGLTLLFLALLGRAAAHAARVARPQRLTNALQLVVAVAAPYAALVAGVAAASAGPAVRPDVGRALLAGSVVAVSGAAWGVLRGSGLREQLRASLPEWLTETAGAAALAVALLLAGGALLAGGSLAVHLGRAADLSRASSPGLVGGLALLAAGVAAVPNAAIWGLAWLAGPGFAIGVGTAVGPFATQLGAVPGLPLLAALPAGSPPVWLGLATLAVPVLAGAVPGWALGRELPDLAAVTRRAALVGTAAGLLVAALAALSGGPLGSGRLAAVGPSPWQVGLAVAAEVALGVVVGAGAQRWRPRP